MVYYKILSIIIGFIPSYIVRKIKYKKKDGVPPKYDEYRPPEVVKHSTALSSPNS